MLFRYSVVLVFLLMGVGFVLVALLIGSLLRPRAPKKEKLSIYECGERPIGEAWFNFNPRFYILAIVFIIFDVEIALTIPVAVVFREFINANLGTIAFVEVLLFLLILTLALVYVWRFKDIYWLKKLGHVSPLRENERKYYHY